jgi:hypothetical protein
MRRRNIYAPVKEQFQLLVGYIEILDSKNAIDLIEEIVMLIELISTIKKQCDLYLNYELTLQGKKIRE